MLPPMKLKNPTRGKGLLEEFLAEKRAEKANNCILKSSRAGRILDIGCGSYPYFLSTTNFKEKYGIDPSLKVSSDQNIKLLKKDVTKQKLPFKDNFFDVVTMLAVFEHIDNDKMDIVLKEIIRVLKKEGIFIITTPSPWSDKLLHNMAKIGLISSVEIHEHKTHHSKEKVKEVLFKAGFNRSRINSGYFEVYMNMWFTAQK
jgi:ubiquinone/menaquinone biosynthesis C-methylase UbiE